MEFCPHFGFYFRCHAWNHSWFHWSTSPHANSQSHARFFNYVHIYYAIFYKASFILLYYAWFCFTVGNLIFKYFSYLNPQIITSFINIRALFKHKICICKVIKKNKNISKHCHAHYDWRNKVLKKLTFICKKMYKKTKSMPTTYMIENLLSAYTSTIFRACSVTNLLRMILSMRSQVH